MAVNLVMMLRCVVGIVFSHSIALSSPKAAYLTAKYSTARIFRNNQSMSETGQTRRFDHRPITSGFTRSTDILSVRRHVSKVPQTDLCTAAKTTLNQRSD